MDPQLRWVAAAFCCFRLAELLVLDDGPWDVFLKLRTWLGVYNLGIDDRPSSNLGRIFECVYCLGIYLGFGLMLLVFYPTGLGDAFLISLGLSGAQSVLHKIAER